ncbi:hypothetical protein [Coleofasciculus sp.]|uniref:hypothetical protein n=1 Tax=Coleofasciculus sp. TaxID=3100458 RepID=UPI003A2CC238
MLRLGAGEAEGDECYQPLQFRLNPRVPPPPNPRRNRLCLYGENSCLAVIESIDTLTTDNFPQYVLGFEEVAIRT